MVESASTSGATTNPTMRIKAITRLDRCCNPTACFLDAEEQAGATVAYLRTNHGRKIDCIFLGAKTKVATLRLRSIPRLELDAAVMESRFAKRILDELSITVSKTYFWCDSKTVLGWIKSNTYRNNKFVAFRVAEIQDDDRVGIWRYVPSKLNVAGEATKWIRTPKLEVDSRWFQGPSFLLDAEDKWPKDVVTEPEIMEELLGIHVTQQPFIDVTRFSKWSKLLRTMAYVIRFLNIKFKMKPELPTKGILNSNELKLAEILLFRMAQRDVYYEEIHSLQDKYRKKNDFQQTVKHSSPIRRLSPYLDEQQVLRVRGRLDAATFIDEESRRPVMLLLVQKCHEKFLHSNSESCDKDMPFRN